MHWRQVKTQCPEAVTASFEVDDNDGDDVDRDDSTDDDDADDD